MALRRIADKLGLPLKRCIRRQFELGSIAEAGTVRLRRILLRPDLCEELCSQLEASIAESRESHELAGEIGDEDSAEFQHAVNFLTGMWPVVLSKASALVQLYATDREES